MNKLLLSIIIFSIIIMNSNVEKEVDKHISKISANRRKNIISIQLSIKQKIYKLFPKLSEVEKNAADKYIDDQIKKIIKANSNVIKSVKNEIMLEEFTHDDIKYYKDEYDNIWDEECDIVGVIKKTNDSDEKYYFFDE
jgi:hypothetical protein